MRREIIRIDEDLCNGCGDCVPNCHEGALQVIDGKVRMVSELMCDGLGACLGHCPVGALTIEKREAQPYDEVLVIKEMVPKGKNLIVAHLKHLKEHNEVAFLQAAVQYLESVRTTLPFDLDEVKSAVHGSPKTAAAQHAQAHQHHGGGCPGSRVMAFDSADIKMDEQGPQNSQLTHWPIQLHLINPAAQFFKGADMLIAADCVAFSLGGFHQGHLKGKTLAIACPKLDDGQDTYLEKVKVLIDQTLVNTITVMIMEVPCCGGLLRMVKTAAEECTRKVPIKLIVVGIKGQVLKEEWV